MKFEWYKQGLPHIDIKSLTGKLLVIEGADASGRSTQAASIKAWLENLGYAVMDIGIKRSMLVSDELREAQKGNTLSHTTMSLFYATDFADQLENKIIPALRAGMIVLCDRYIYTLMARDSVRGASSEWLKEIYGFALIPQLVVYLQVDPQHLVERYFQKNMRLGYWESGMDLGLAPNFFDSFILYQTKIRDTFLEMRHHYDFKICDGHKAIDDITEDIKTLIKPILDLE
jgi:dTMP kinase